MIKTLLGQVGEYKKDSILTPVFTAAEVFMEILIPFVTAKIIDEGINGQDMSKGIYVWRTYACVGFPESFLWSDGGKIRCQRIDRICMQPEGGHVQECAGVFIYQH